MKKRIIVGGIIIILLFGLLNIVWFAHSYYVYSPFTKNIPKHESGMYVYYDNESNYIYNVKFPVYLSFNGNLGVANNEGSGLVIWPGFLGKNYTYGVRVNVDGHVYSMNLDRNMQLIDEEVEIKKIYNENTELIKKLWDGANSKWGEVINQ